MFLESLIFKFLPKGTKTGGEQVAVAAVANTSNLSRVILNSYLRATEYMYIISQRGNYSREKPGTGCSLNIVFFLNILKYFVLWPFSVFPRRQCLYTHKAGRTPALQ